MPYLSGAEFNATNTRRLCKLTNVTSCHNGFQYREGLNIDHIPLSLGHCSAGGLYLTYENCWYRWTSYGLSRPKMNMYYIWDVEIPDDATVITEDWTKLKATAIILSNCRPIKELEAWKNPTFQRLATEDLDNYGCEYNYTFFPNLTREQQLSMVSRSGSLIRFIDNPPKEVQIQAVKNGPRSIEYIKEPSEEVQMLAIKGNPCSIEYIKEPSEEVQMLAIKGNPACIRYIKDPSKEAQIWAVKADPLCILYIKDPSKEVQIQAVKADPSRILSIKDPSEEVQIQAVKTDPFLIRYIKDPSDKVLIETYRPQYGDPFKEWIQRYRRDHPLGQISGDYGSFGVEFRKYMY